MLFSKNKKSVDDTMPAELSMGVVTLKTANVDKLKSYYINAIGLVELDASASGVVLGRTGVPLVIIESANGFKLPSQNEAGLYHLAILFDTQSALSATVLRALRHDSSKFVGSSDHLVSEAFYFTDPEGNGIELYWDRPRDAWTWSNGMVAMDTVYMPWDKYIQTHGVLGEDETAGDMTAEVGHVHLQVGNIPAAHSFYVDALGFDATAKLGNSALFVSAGGYHHHLAMNTWNSTGAGPRRNTLGLGSVDITVPMETDLSAISDRLWIHGHHADLTERGLEVRDPWNTLLVLSPAKSA